MNFQLEEKCYINEELLNAIKEGNKKEVEILLYHNENSINNMTSNQIYLKTAVLYRKSEIIKILLDNGASIRISPEIFPDFVNENKDIIKLLLKNSVNLESRNTEGATYLHLAVKNQLTDIVDILIKKGADVNAKITASEISVLLIAFQEKNNEIIDLLLQCDIDIKQQDSKRETPLHYAVIYENAKYVKMIIDKGADINAVNKLGLTPLHIAILKNNIHITKLLIQHDANVNSKTIEKRSPLHLAAAIQSIEMVELLLKKGAHINDCTDTGIAPIHTAVNTGNIEIVKLLIDNNAEVNATGIRDETPLNIAVAYEHEKIVEYLISHGAIVNHGLKDDMILHMAVVNRSEKLVALLLKSGADVTVKYKDGTTALHLAARFKCPGIAEMLLKHGIGVNKQTDTDDTALHIAVQNKDYEMCKVLLKNNPNINFRNSSGYTPLYIAAEKGLLNIVIELLKHKPNKDENKLALHYAVKGNDVQHKKIISELLASGFLIDFVKNNFSESFDFVKHSVSNGHLGIVEYLLKFGLDPNMPTPSVEENENYKTLLHVAVDNNQLEISKSLICYGANINSVDEFNKTPLYYAVKRDNFEILKLLFDNKASVGNDLKLFFMVISKGNHSIIKEFLKHFKNINAEDEFGTTALHFAAWNQDEEIIQLFLDKGAKYRAVDDLKQICFTRETESRICDYYGSDVLEDFRKNIITTPLHVAARKNNSDIVEALLEYGFKADCRDGCGRTALHIASIYNSTGVIDVLIEFNPELLYATDESGCTCVDYVYNREQFYSNLFLDKVFMFIHQAHHISEICEFSDPMAAAKLLIKYQAKLNSISGIENEKFLECYRSLQDNYKNCKLEIEKLKSKTILKNITFYDVLIKSISTLASYLKNENFLPTLETEIQKSEICIYNSILIKRIRRAKERKILLIEADPYFIEVLCLPELISRHIMNYLQNRDLRHIKEVYESFLNQIKFIKCKKS